MKKTAPYILAILGFCALLFGFAAVGADTNSLPAAASVADTTPFAGADTTGAIVAPFISGLVVKFPWVMTILTVMGAARVLAKPLFSALESSLGPDNALAKNLAAAESGTIYKSVSWLLDFFFSIKSHLITPPKA
jgi:hypothetical protein